VSDWKRIPNATISCELCGSSLTYYRRPSAPARRFCSRACAIKITIATRKSPARWGQEHHAWKGDDATQRAGRSRAERAFKNIGPCSDCGAAKSERHHKDENTLNNDPSNIEILCRRCHARRHIDLLRSNARKMQRLGVAARWPK
jgi:hypothetical protein